MAVSIKTFVLVSCSKTHFIPDKVLVLSTHAVFPILYVISFPFTFPEKYKERNSSNRDKNRVLSNFKLFVPCIFL